MSDTQKWNLSKSIAFSIMAVAAAVIALFASGPLVTSGQAFPGFDFPGWGGGDCCARS